MRQAALEEPRLDPEVVEQAMLWMVRLQSGASSDGEQLACLQWRQENPANERAWQRLAGLGQGLRDATCSLPAPRARRLLQARTQVSRRAVLGGLAGAGVLMLAGLGASQRSFMPTLLSDFATATGQRHTWRLDGGVELQLDTHSALDSDRLAGLQVLTLNRGRVLLEAGQGARVSLRTAQVSISPARASRLIVAQQRTATLVQVLDGQVLVDYGQGARAELDAGWQQRFYGVGAGPLAALPTGASAWTQGLLLAERLPLGQLLQELDRYRPGLLRCDPRVEGLLVSGSFSVDQPDASLDLLTQVLPIRVQRVLGYWATVLPA